MRRIYVAVEGITDQAVAERLVSLAGGQIESLIFPKGGKTELRKKILAYNEAAKLHPWFVLTDLDSPERCPVEYAKSWLSNPSNQMCFRVAVSQMESWLLASRRTFARYLSISEALIPLEPEKIKNPKLEIISLANRSRSLKIRQDMVRNGSIGPLYSHHIIRYIHKYWDIEEARKNSESLDRCIHALNRLLK
jgi:hypothetical protein